MIKVVGFNILNRVFFFIFFLKSYLGLMTWITSPSTLNLHFISLSLFCDFDNGIGRLTKLTLFCPFFKWLSPQSHYLIFCLIYN
jgi:hypothetical protein